MPLHPQAAQLLSLIGQGPPLATQSIEMNRTNLESAIPLTGSPTPIHSIENISIQTPHGPVPARLYRTSDAVSQPTLIYFHGGGWMLGTLDLVDATARDVAAFGNIAVVSVDYRLAPEHPYPAAHDDALGVARAALAGQILGVDPQRIAVGGDSAGGNLAAFVSQELRHEPGLRHQVLIYPVTQIKVGATESYRQYAEGYFMSAADMQYFFDNYAPNADSSDFRISVAANPNLGGQPSATFVLAEFDPLRDEGEAYAAALKAAGVDVELRRFDGHFHPFVYLAGAVDAAIDARRFIGESVQKALSRQQV